MIQFLGKGWIYLPEKTLGKTEILEITKTPRNYRIKQIQPYKSEVENQKLTQVNMSILCF